jgi:molecular chaperone DnaK (HSP70)
MAEKRYVIGIDLGTSNCALSFIDTLVSPDEAQACSLSIRQPQSPTSETSDQLLPSFCLIPSESVSQNITVGSPVLPLLSDRHLLVGRYAQERSAFDSGRVIHSAKSWLTNNAVDRRASLLPWNSDSIDEALKLSPIEASAAYLYHLKEIWNEQIARRSPEARFEDQDITVTVPASFDEVAQQLTLEAARIAGFPENTKLLEEPQAAFYYFLEQHQELLTREQALQRRPLSLVVCDVGGGTTDFSVFRIHSSEQLERIAVSSHLLLGGDNIDLTLTHFFEQQIGERLVSHRWSALLAQARSLKERFLERSVVGQDKIFKVSVPPKGSNLFESSVSLEVSSKDLLELIIEGFFPIVPKDAVPEMKSSGIREFGLPYAADCGITRHLAQFLQPHLPIDALLLTGGTLKPKLFQQRILETIAGWQDGKRPYLLPNQQMEHAVAHGAARYGLALRSMATRIRGGYPHAVYLEVKQGKQSVAICILPKGAEAGTEFTLDSHSFSATTGTAVKFQLFTSRFRTEDRPGDIIDMGAFEEQLTALPPLQTVLERRGTGIGRHRVTLRGRLNEVGLLKLSCQEVDGDEEWSLDFNLRRLTEKQTPSPAPGVPAHRQKPLPHMDKAFQKIEAIYGGKQHKDLSFNPRRLTAELENTLKTKKEEWNTATLRALWGPLSEGITKRSRSLAHEISFLSLAGFCLRPGYSVELDEFRVKELWRCFHQGLFYPKERSAQQQWWIMWRRVAAGLTSSQQDQLLLASRSLLFKESEALRLFGSLERVNHSHKVSIGDKICEMIRQNDPALTTHCYWTLERIASRIPVYAGNQAVIAPHHVEKWFRLLKALDWKRACQPLRNVFLTGCRLTGDRARDLSPELLVAIRQKLQESGVSKQEIMLLDQVVEVSESDQAEGFGEKLPPGLVLIAS